MLNTTVQRNFARPYYMQLFRVAVGRIMRKDHTVCPFMGGLEKLQGGLKEEKYFNQQNLTLIMELGKIGKDGKKLKYECCAGNWDEFEKIGTITEERTALRETCSKNKHKNCMEEAFFLSEHCDTVKHLNEKLQSADTKADEQDDDEASMYKQ